MRPPMTSQSCVIALIYPLPAQARVHLSCTCAPSLHRHSFILSFLLSLPRSDCPSSPALLSLSSLASSSYLSLWFIGGGVQFTHIPLLTPSPPPTPSCNRALISVVCLHDRPMERRRGRVRDNRRSCVFVEWARLSFHIPLSASILVVSAVCVCV